MAVNEVNGKITYTCCTFIIGKNNVRIPYVRSYFAFQSSFVILPFSAVLYAETETETKTCLCYDVSNTAAAACCHLA